MEAKNSHLSGVKRTSIRSRVWRLFHSWTLAAIFFLTAANVVSALRPFESAFDQAHGVAPFIQLGGPNKKSGQPEREPAATGNSSAAHSANDQMTELRLDCQQRVEVRLPEQIQSLRLQLSDCLTGTKAPGEKAPASVPLPSYYVRNETNGFEGTIFRLPTSRDRISTDFITLEKGPNTIRISRSVEDQPSVEQWLTIVRQ